MASPLFKYSLLLLLTALVVSCGGSGGDGVIAVTCGDNEAVYVRMGADDSNPGTIFEPLATIQAAVRCGQPGQEIRVANGSYAATVDTGAVVLDEGKSIYGGYSSDFQVRDPNVYPTIISAVGDTTDVMPQTTCAVKTNPSTTPLTVLDGFTINGADQGYNPGDSTMAISITGSPTVSNNIINGAGSSAIDFSRGIKIESGSPVIESNEINGGGGKREAIGINAILAASATITENMISGDGGVFTMYTSAILIQTAGSDTIKISNNLIVGGDATFWSEGININADTSVIIENNTIASGSTLINDSYGIYVYGGAPVIRNNTIELQGLSSYGILNRDGTGSTISANTIVGGGSDNSLGIYLRTGSATKLRNNIIHIDEGVCITEDDPDSDPVAVQNNDLTGCSTLYVDEGAIGLIDIVDINSLSDTNASDNVSIPPVLDSAQDFQLTAGSPLAVTQGGLDLSEDFRTDKLGNTRTVPWSIGAYEYD